MGLGSQVKVLGVLRVEHFGFRSLAPKVTGFMIYPGYQDILQSLKMRRPGQLKA